MNRYQIKSRSANGKTYWAVIDTFSGEMVAWDAMYSGCQEV